MGVKSNTYNTITGSFTLHVPELAFRNIISVKSEGTGYAIVRTGLPANQQVLYTASGGLFTFVNAFVGTVIDHGTWDELIPAKVFIVWDE